MFPSPASVSVFRGCLCRLPQANPEKEAEIGPRIISVDYSDINQLRSTLETFSISTVISTLTSSLGIESELNLIQTASKSVVTRRYIANVWGITYTPEYGYLTQDETSLTCSVQGVEGIPSCRRQSTCHVSSRGFLARIDLLPQWVSLRLLRYASRKVAYDASSGFGRHDAQHGYRSRLWVSYCCYGVQLRHCKVCRHSSGSGSLGEGDVFHWG
ncbi:hypothetical protein CABS02_09054 [Colletotrichum abscissum]|uniref:Uncharacterized protein n=1 Tax=Colletotrichum abscissum TaxID=1671311 RepID=A0A9Q0B0V8_9PEZI|nr:hypothetical protein CABS02_09054 [Colletotrichum abscissum]